MDRKIDGPRFVYLRYHESMSRTTDRAASALTEADWERLCGAAETHRTELVLRLCGEAGLRAAEVPRVRPADVRRGPTGHGGAFLTVRDGSGAPTREAYLATTVHHALHQYVRSNDVDPEARVVDVSTRRVQMLVREVAERAASVHHRPDLAGVTPSTLRRRFARHLLEADGVDPRIVKAVGGWERLDGLVPEGEPDRSTVATAVERAADGEEGGDAGRLAVVTEGMATVGEALADASDRATIETAVCEALAASEAYEAAWLTETDRHRDRVEVRESAGGGPERFEGARDVTIVRQARQSGRVIVGPDRSMRGETGEGSLAAVPVDDGEAEYGVLVVRTDAGAAFDAPERTALADLGRRIGAALTATKRRQLLLGDTVLSLGFAYQREDVFTDCGASLESAVTLEGLVPGDGDRLVCFVRVEAAEPQAALACVDDHPDTASARIVRRVEGDVILEVIVEPGTPLSTVTEQGGTVQQLQVESGRAELLAEFAPDVDVRTVAETLADACPSAELRRKQEQPRTGEGTPALQDTLSEELTERQRSVLRAALHAGYFEWPRGSTAEELADSLGVSSPTLHNHLRRAQQKLLEAALADERDRPPAVRSDE